MSAAPRSSSASSDAVDSAGGTWDGHEPWGRRRLAYEISTRTRRSITCCMFTSPPETLAEITRVLKITDGVIRHGAFRRVKDGHTKAPSQIPAGAPPAAAPSDDDGDRVATAVRADDSAEADE